MKKTDEEYYQHIVQYYHETEIPYREGWDLDKSMALHVGYWDEKARTFRKAVARLNEKLAEKGHLKKGDYILDAGCGVGGSAIFLAKNIGCRVLGITLSSRQAEMAKQNAQKHAIVHEVNFEVANFMDSQLPSESFDVVWGVESICHALDKEAFVKQAYRLLKPGGRLVMADYFRIRNPNNKEEEYDYSFFLNGFAVDNLTTIPEFVSYLKNEGFEKIETEDCQKHFSPNLTRIKILGLVSTVLTQILHLIGVRRKQSFKNIGGKVALMYVKLFKNGMLTYQFVVAEK